MTDFCELCGRFAPLDVHHIYGGTRRQISEKYGAVVHICRACHNDIHQHPAKYKWLQVQMQEQIEAWNGWTEEDFRSRFGKSYKED